MWKTRRELLACISRSPSLRTGDRRHRCGNPHPLRCASGGPLSFFGKRKGGEERRQNQGFEILSAAEVPSASVLPTPRVGMCKFCALLSHRLCVPIRDALCACAGLAKQGKPLRLLRGGVRARRPTQSQKLDSVGADDPVAVPKISMLPCGCRMKF